MNHDSAKKLESNKNYLAHPQKIRAAKKLEHLWYIFKQRTLGILRTLDIQ